MESLEDERDFADAMGFPSFQGGKAGLIFLIDLTMGGEQRKSVQRMIRKMPADRLLVVGFGDKAETDSHRLFSAEEDEREAACRKIDGYSVSKHRRLLDALEAVLALQACTRVDLCLTGLPSGGGRETLEYLKRRRDLVPINCVDFSQGNAEVSAFLQELVAISRGTYSKGI